MVAGVIAESRWGTWLELLLAGAVIRYGTRDWNLVSAELRARTFCPYAFTPEVCEAKYEDMRKRYSGCKAWFEELRKKRMEELRQALEQSENSIGSLESKLESLKVEKGVGRCQMESPIPSQKLEERYPSGIDEPSAGSFTCEALTSCSPQCQTPAAVSAEDTEIKREVLRSSQQKISIGAFYGGLGVTPRKRRGKRKRKDCSRDVKEVSVGESGFLGSIDAVNGMRCIEHSNNDWREDLVSSGAIDWNRGLITNETNHLLDIFNRILEHKSASVFRHRLDSQKRRRYKRMIRRHMDFDTIESQIASNYVMSAKELYRDLLVLANNAIVFYSKSTREYKSALLLREVITKTLQQHCKDSISKKATSVNPSSNKIGCNPSVKPRGARPGNRKQSRKATSAGKTAATTSNKVKKAGNANADSSPSVESFAVTKRTSGQPRKVGRKTIAKQNVVPAKGRKRGRTK